ncbi:hypothetical protein, partial [Enterococcus entomosocium]|uniref:hypothetical protein n=1 Tax=Enterococcus entomosocium TaxID=3034352 RepID=UPI0026494B74
VKEYQNQFQKFKLFLFGWSFQINLGKVWFWWWIENDMTLAPFFLPDYHNMETTTVDQSLL